MTFPNLHAAAQADPVILQILASEREHTAAAELINQQGEFTTSESAVRRWRAKWLGADPPAPDEDEELSEDVGVGMDLGDAESHVEPGWQGFGESDRAVIHSRLDAALDAVKASPGDVAGLRVSTYQTVTKDAAGEPHIHDLFAVKLLVKTRDLTPEWPVIQQARPSLVSVHPAPARPLNMAPPPGWKTAVILPDLQAGFFTDTSGNLHPTHDPAAIDIALQLIIEAQPDLILVGGDGVDFPELGRYRLSPVFARTTQATVDWTEGFVARLRALAPNSRIVWLEGNHEFRMSAYILDNAKAAFGLKVAGKPDAWPVLSLPFLARFEEHGVDYIPGYPAAEFWFNDRLKAMHGHKVNSSGSTVHRYLDEERVSTISFHIHRREWGERTRHTRHGERTIMAASPGCLCRIDGAVPSVKGGIGPDGMPVRHAEDWQQGLAVLHYQEGDGLFVYEQIAIHHGWAMWRGKEYRSHLQEG